MSSIAFSRSLALRARGRVHGSLTLLNRPTVADRVVDVGGLSRRQPPPQKIQAAPSAMLNRRNKLRRLTLMNLKLMKMMTTFVACWLFSRQSISVSYPLQWADV